MKIKKLFLFGAGASYGCNGTNEVVPLGSDLFTDLKKRFPATWGSLPHVYENDFEDFEKGMDRLWEDLKYSHEVSNFLQDMAVYFSKFKIIDSEKNLYYKLFSGIKKRGLLKETVLSTINYDCLVEEALERLKIKFKYNIANDVNKTLSFLKIHGSCNFVPDSSIINGKKSSVRYILKNVLCNVPLIPIKPKEVENFFNNSPFPPGMAMYMKGKDVRIGGPSIVSLRNNWQKSIHNAEKVFIVGVNPNLEDHHIWDYIHKKGRVFYCGCKNSFDKWQKNEGRKDIFLNCTFENSFKDIMRYFSI